MSDYDDSNENMNATPASEPVTGVADAITPTNAIGADDASDAATDDSIIINAGISPVDDVDKQTDADNGSIEDNETDDALSDAGSSDGKSMLALYVRFQLWKSELPDKYRRWASDSNKNKDDRDRKLAFVLTPVFLKIITGFFTIMISYGLLLGYMLFSGLSFADANEPASHFYNTYLGIPVALLGMAVVMFSPAVSDVVKLNGGYHASLKPESLNRDMHQKNTAMSWLWIIIIGVFGGMVVWMVHLAMVNGLYAIGVDVTGMSRSTETALTGDNDPRADVGAIGFNGITLFTMLFSLTISPVLEEMVYRGFIARSLVESRFMRLKDGSRSWWQVLIVCMLAGLWFGIGHVTGQDGVAKSIFLFVFMSMFGAFLSWLSCVKFKSIWPGALVHVTYNLITLITAASM